MQLDCHICENKVDIPVKTKPGDRITCTTCFAQLALYRIKGKLVLGCAMCKEPVFDPDNCGNCERRREKQAILEEGIL